MGVWCEAFGVTEIPSVLNHTSLCDLNCLEQHVLFSFSPLTAMSTGKIQTMGHI